MSKVNKYVYLGLAMLGAATVVASIISVTILLVYDFVTSFK